MPKKAASGVTGHALAGHRDAFLDVAMLPQPDDVTCGPTCLHAVYDFLGKTEPLPRLIERVNSLKDGGTLAVFLGIDALERGYSARLYSYDFKVFDPSWRGLTSHALVERLNAQLQFKKGKRFTASSRATPSCPVRECPTSLLNSSPASGGPLSAPSCRRHHCTTRTPLGHRPSLGPLKT